VQSNTILKIEETTPIHCIGTAGKECSSMATLPAENVLQSANITLSNLYAHPESTMETLKPEAPARMSKKEDTQDAPATTAQAETSPTTNASATTVEEHATGIQECVVATEITVTLGTQLLRR
jgi:hypothetical protein